MSELEQVINQLGENFENFKQHYIERLEAVELNQNRIPNPGIGSKDDMTPDQKEHLNTFCEWVRKPHQAKNRAALEEMEQKSVSTDTALYGGNALPEVISKDIGKKLIDRSDIRKIAKVQQVGTSDVKFVVDIGGTEAGWVGEGSARNETATAEIKQVAPTFGTIYAYPKSTEEALNDLIIDVKQWLVENSVEMLAVEENKAFINGDGSSKPTGFLSGTPEAVGDEDSPSRTFGELEYIATGVSDGFGELDQGSPPHYPADVFFDVIYKLKAGYRKNAVWLMNSATAGTIRKFKDADGNYIWQDSLQRGEPSLLAGYPVYYAEDMPDIGADNFPVAYGDFAKGYVICDNMGMRITVDDNITSPGFVKFYLRKRTGGKILNDSAIKVIKCATS